MKSYSPQIEIYPNNNFNLQPDLIQRPWFQSPRFIIFVSVFLVCVLISEAYNFSRPAIFRSDATLLTSAMTAIDSESKAVDIQHVAIQKHILLGHELAAETLSRLKNANTSDAVLTLTPADIQKLLNVDPIAQTNLVEIQAEGRDPEFLPQLINTWIDVYLNARAKDVNQSAATTKNIVESELNGLSEKINSARAELETFRKINDISSTGRNENEPLARLNALNTALNSASGDEVKAKVLLNTVKLAISRGQTVVPEQEQGSLQELEKNLQDLQGQLAEFDKRFTRDYLNKQPALKVIPEQIKKLEAEIIKKREQGKKTALEEAENRYAAAQQNVTEIRAQLNESKKQAAIFTSKFTEHEALKTDLEGLEKLYREKQQRLVQIQTTHKEKYPQVTVINRAFPSVDPIKPDYSRDALIALAGSIVLGLFSVWMFDYLTRRQRQPSPPITLSGIHMYHPAAADGLNYQQAAPLPIQQRPTNALASPVNRELSVHQLRILLNASNLKGKQVISLLLSGLTLEEAASLKAEQLDLEKATLTVTGSAPRTLTLNHALTALFSQSGDRPVWDTGNAASTDDLAAALLCAAVDSGLPNPGEISAESIRHSYIAYLVRQGLRLADLEHITGYLEPSVISGYSTYSPPQQGRGFDDIELLHPALNGLG